MRIKKICSAAGWGLLTLFGGLPIVLYLEHINEHPHCPWCQINIERGQLLCYSCNNNIKWR